MDLVFNIKTSYKQSKTDKILHEIQLSLQFTYNVFIIQKSKPKAAKTDISKFVLAPQGRMSNKEDSRSTGQLDLLSEETAFPRAV